MKMKTIIKLTTFLSILFAMSSSNAFQYNDAPYVEIPEQSTLAWDPTPPESICSPWPACDIQKRYYGVTDTK